MPALWRVFYDDCDEEDLEEAELKEAIHLYESRNTGCSPSKKQRVAPREKESAARSAEETPSPDQHAFVEGLQEGDHCTICLCDMHPDTAKPHALIKLNKCGHVFHSECLRSCSAKMQNTCPLCRAHYSARLNLPPEQCRHPFEQDAEDDFMMQAEKNRRWRCCRVTSCLKGASKLHRGSRVLQKLAEGAALPNGKLSATMIPLSKQHEHAAPT
jgi:hypothetical protein